MKYTKIPEDTFKQIQLNAGVLVKNFNPATQEFEGLMGATSGGVSFNATPTYEDFGEDIDNAPKNTKEFKQLTEWAVALSGNYVTVTPDMARSLVGAADIDPNDPTKIVPRNEVLAGDFEDIWWIGDYSNVNEGTNAGYCAIHMINALNTSGFQITSTDKGKGQFAFNYEGHYSMNAQNTVPFEVYIKAGSEEAMPSIFLNTHSTTVEEGDEVVLTAQVIPAGETVTWSSGDTSVATVSGGTITAVAEGNTIVTASITVDGVTYNDTCTVVVNEATEG